MPDGGECRLDWYCSHGEALEPGVDPVIAIAEAAGTVIAA